ncbi:hypothetical protein FRC00_008610 [Tulasnella sp. 408]|nr:hypothetical protein FRC00_008610 [Tulasnella sp. 408]
MMTSTQQFDPEKAENLPEVLDDEIFEDFSKTFPHYVENLDSLAKLDEEQVKSNEGKDKWREFMGRYEKKINDYNFGTLLRPDCKDEYTEKNSMFGEFALSTLVGRPLQTIVSPDLVTRTQFYAIEIARNRLGLNDEIHLQAKAHAEKEKQAKAAAAAAQSS